MSYRIIISSQAERQIDNIISYVTIDLANPSAASNILSAIEGAYGELESSGGSFALCLDPYLSRKGYRKYVLHDYDYVIIYALKGDTVQISGIFHTKENYIRKL